MRVAVFFVLLLGSMGAALAGEERQSASFERLARSATKVFVGSVHAVERFDDGRGKFKIVSIEAYEAWKGVSAGEIVRVLSFEGVAHGADPEREGKRGALLVYLSPAPAKASFRKFGPSLFMPAGGESSVISLADADATELLAAARAGLAGPVPTGALLSQIESSHERVRENALASLALRSGQELRALAPLLGSRLGREAVSAMQADLVLLLAKSGEPEALDPLIEYALERPEAEEAIPLVAHALNAIDAAEAVRRIEAIVPSTEDADARALSLLGRLDTPEAIRVLLERARARQEISSAEGHALSLNAGIEDPVSLLAAGSREQKQLAAYRLYRWGSKEQKIRVREESKRAADPALRRFLEKLVREPYLSYSEL